MKEQTSHRLHDDKLQPHLQWELFDKPHSSYNLPKPRYKHQTFIYQNTLYLYGGTTIPLNQTLDDPLDIYKFSLDSNQWEKVRLKCNSKDLEVVSGHCAALNGSRWFMFGGTNNDFRCNNYLWRLNLQTFEMNRLQNRGEIPAARDSASLLCMDKNWLLLYGGVNVNSIEIYNTFHFYNIETRYWTKCEGPYQYQVYSRFDPALTLISNKLYMFGGTYRNRQNQELYLNDFYEFDISLPARGAPSKIATRRLLNDPMPEPRSGHILANLGDGYLLLLGGQNSQTKIKDGIKFDDATIVGNAWIYCIEANIWRKITVKNNNRFKFKSQFSLSALENNNLLVFGGIHSYSSVSNQLMQITAVNYHLKSTPKINTCIKCDQKSKFKHKEHYISAQIIEDIAESVEFPFSAIGLLIDNGFNHGATFINIFYHQQIGSQKIKALRIEDNARLLWSEEQLFNTMASFSASPPCVLSSSTDKKIKMAYQKQNLRMDYGSNCKIGSLRLGTGFLHISISQNDNSIRVCLFKKQEDNNKKNRYILLCYSYKQNMCEISEPRKYVQKIFGQLIEDALSQCNVKNTLFILQPKIQNINANNEEQIELKVNIATNDIINGQYSNYTALDKAGYNISDCVDVSLKAYITCLYLKNQTTLIALSVRNTDPVSIPTQAYLQKVDKLCKYKHVLQINNVIQFQFKIVELYYLYDLKRKLNYFNNGLLIYHKNKLISRYKYPLGELIPRKIYKIEGNCNLLRMFGFIQLPDHVPVNIFKTNVLHPLMTEKLFSRLKFINKMFKKELQKMVVDKNYKRFAPTKLSNEEKEQDFKDYPELKAETDVNGKEKHRKLAQKEKSRKVISNFQVKIVPQNENQELKLNDCFKKDNQIESIKEGVSKDAGNIVYKQEQPVKYFMNQNQMQNESSDSSAQEQGREQQINEQEVEIRHFGINQSNQINAVQAAQPIQEQKKQIVKVEIQKNNQQNGNFQSREIQQQQSADSKEAEINGRKDLRKTSNNQKANMQDQLNQMKEDIKEQLDR